MSYLSVFLFVQQVWQNLNIEGILPGSNMLMGVVVDEMAKAIELKSDAELKVEF